MAEEFTPLMSNEKRPSTMASVISGIGGMIRGGLGAAVLGGLVTATLASVAVVIGGPATLEPIVAGAFSTTATGAAAAIGYTALAGAVTMGAIGTALGGVAGVVQSREAAKPKVEEIAKVAFAQGVAVGHALEAQENVMKQEASTKFRDMVGKSEKPESFRDMVEQQAAAAIGQNTKLH